MFKTKRVEAKTVVVNAEGIVVATVRQFGNKRYGAVDLKGKSISDESFRTLADLSTNFERISTWLSFGEVAREQLNQQCQYASRMVDGRHGYPNLGYDLRFQDRTGGPLDTGDYHDIRIHRDDIPEFVRRVKAYRASINEEF